MKTQKLTKTAGIILGVLIVLIIGIALIPGSEKKLEETRDSLEETRQGLEQQVKEELQPSPVAEEKTWEEKLAQLETNNPNPDPATVQVFHRQLVKLTAMCEENEQWVSDHIVQGQNALKKKGVKATLQEIGQGFDDAVVELPDKTCEEAFATYLTGKATGQL